MDIQKVYGQFMNMAEYGHTKIEAFRMTKDLYLKLLNRDLKKSLYEGGLRITIINSSLCLEMIHSYPILLSKGFNEKYAFEPIYYMSDEEKYLQSKNKA